MDRMVICKKCGYITNEHTINRDGECLECGNKKDNFIVCDGDYSTLEEKYEKEIQEECIKRYGEEVHIGSQKVNAFKEVLRQKYLYGHSDMINDYLMKQREYHSSKEYLNELYRSSLEYKIKHDSGNSPKCPSCGSTNLTKLSNAGKVAKIGLFGIFGAGNLGKTYKCNNCGIKF